MFSSKTCVPCQTIKPTINDLKDEFSMLDWKDIDIHVDTETTKKYGVTKVPTMVVESNGLIQSHSGTAVMGYYRILKAATSRG